MVSIGIYPRAALDENLFTQLGLVLGIEFTALDDHRTFQGRIILVAGNAIGAALKQWAEDGIPTMVVNREHASSADSEDKLNFAVSESVPEVFRGREVSVKKAAYTTFASTEGFEPLVTAKGGVVCASDRACIASGFCLPKLGEYEILADYLNGETFAELLPLYHFLRTLTKGNENIGDYRACIIVDDPNLHRPTYGHLDYASLLKLGSDHRAHFSMATVPFDAWWIGRRPAAMFCQNPDVLSLLIHGAVHTHHELASTQAGGTGAEMFAYVARKVAQIETGSGVKVSKIVAPPHGVVSEETMRQMLPFGIEGVTTNRWSLWKYNDRTSRPPRTGLTSADILAGAMPVIERFRFNSTHCLTDLLIAAYLGKPIIPYGHHQDFADLKTVVQTVNWVNSLGPVKWMDPDELFKTNFSITRTEDHCCITPFSRSVKLRTPPSRTLRVRNPGFSSSMVDGVWVGFTEDGRDPSASQRVNFDELVEIPSAGWVSILVNGHPQNANREREQKVSLGQAMRRVAAEARDRLRI